MITLFINIVFYENPFPYLFCRVIYQNLVKFKSDGQCDSLLNKVSQVK